MRVRSRQVLRTEWTGLPRRESVPVGARDEASGDHAIIRTTPLDWRRTTRLPSVSRSAPSSTDSGPFPSPPRPANHGGTEMKHAPGDQASDDIQDDESAASPTDNAPLLPPRH